MEAFSDDLVYKIIKHCENRAKYFGEKVPIQGDTFGVDEYEFEQMLGLLEQSHMIMTCRIGDSTITPIQACPAWLGHHFAREYERNQRVEARLQSLEKFFQDALQEPSE